MAGIGAELAGGASGVYDYLRQQIEDRIRQQMAQQKMSLDARSADRADQALSQQDELKRLQIQSVADAKAEAARGAEEGRVMRAVNMRPTGADVSPQEYSRETGFGLPTGLYTPKGIEEPQAPEGIAAPADPKMITGRLQMMPDTIAGSPAPSQRTYSFRGTQSEADKQAELQRKTQADQDRADNANWRAGIQNDLANFKMSQPPKEPTNSYQLQPEIDPATGKQTGRFLGYNTKLNRWEPVQGNGPEATKPAPGAAQAAQQDRTTKDALDSLSQLDQAVQQAKAYIGPGRGQFSSLEQMAGAADPSIQALGAKMILTKMRVDHAATGTVRASASPALIKLWDNILGNKVTPEGMTAAVQAMREILGGMNAGQAGGAVHMKAPDGRDLNVPADKVADLEKLGAKRVP